MKQRVITLQGRPTLTGRDVVVPSDLSSAAFFLVAGLLVPGSNLVIQGVGLNPSRSALLDFLLSTGADIKVLKIEAVNGEPIGDIQVKHAPIRGGVIEKDMAAALIDEIPVLAVLGAASEEGLVVRDAAELRIKETDRIATVAENFKRMGIEIEVTPDGMRVPGNRSFARRRSIRSGIIGLRWRSRWRRCAAMGSRRLRIRRRLRFRFRSFGGFWRRLRDCND